MAELEEIIGQGLQTYIDVGNALNEIRSRRLYHDQDYTTFEDYCRERWGFNRKHAHRLIDAARVASVLDQSLIPEVSPMGDTEDLRAESARKSEIPLPTTERQARELARIDDPAEMRATMREAVEIHGVENLTAAKIAEVREDRAERVVIEQQTPMASGERIVPTPPPPKPDPSGEDPARDRKIAAGTTETAPPIDEETRRRLNQAIAAMNAVRRHVETLTVESAVVIKDVDTERKKLRDVIFLMRDRANALEDVLMGKVSA